MSVEALQVNPIPVLDVATAARFIGAVGGVVSGGSPGAAPEDEDPGMLVVALQPARHRARARDAVR